MLIPFHACLVPLVRSGLPSAKRVLLSGHSAGAAAVFIHADAIHSKLRAAAPHLQVYKASQTHISHTMHRVDLSWQSRKKLKLKKVKSRAGLGFQNGTNSRDLRCLLAPNTFRCRCWVQNMSRIQNNEVQAPFDSCLGVQIQCGANFLILDSRRVLAQAPEVPGSDIKTHPKSRFCAILKRRGAMQDVKIHAWVFKAMPDAGFFLDIPSALDGAHHLRGQYQSMSVHSTATHLRCMLDASVLAWRTPWVASTSRQSW